MAAGGGAHGGDASATRAGAHTFARARIVIRLLPLLLSFRSCSRTPPPAARAVVLTCDTKARVSGRFVDGYPEEERSRDAHGGVAKATCASAHTLPRARFYG